MIEGECDDPDLEVTDWAPDELAVCAAPGHPLAHAGPVPLTRALAEWWVVRERGSGTRQTLDRALGERSIHLRVRLELEHTEGIKRAVEAGLGLGCVSRLALRDAFARGSLVEIPVEGLDLRRRFRFLVHRRKYHTPAMEAFLSLCREAAASPLWG